MGNEEWRDIPEWEGLYQASSLGRIRSLGRTVSGIDRRGRRYARSYPERVMALFTLAHGYVAVGLSDEGRKGLKYVHRLVAAAFHGAPLSGLEAAHLNGDRADNRPCNLEWQTSARNAQERIVHGTQYHGSMIASSKLNEESAREVFSRYKSANSSYAVAKEFGVSASTVQRIVSGKYWRRAIGQEKHV